jgi:hypothetical protein
MELGRRSIQAALVGALILGNLATTSAMAAAPPTVEGSSAILRADLEGTPIKVTDVSAYYCHDFDYPELHCFATSEALEEALIGEAWPSGPRSLSATMVTAAFGPNDYVTIYSGSSYAGTFAHLAQNYDSLALIGWNDNVSSFKGRNSRRGVFREHWFAGGATTTFCCNQNIPSLPSGVDNTFSSVYRT